MPFRPSNGIIHGVALKACVVVVLNAAVVMKISKKGKGPQQIWIPLERLWFDKFQRKQVRHCCGSGSGYRIQCTLHFAVMAWFGCWHDMQYGARHSRLIAYGVIFEYAAYEAASEHTDQHIAPSVCGCPAKPPSRL